MVISFMEIAFPSPKITFFRLPRAQNDLLVCCYAFQLFASNSNGQFEVHIYIFYQCNLRISKIRFCRRQNSFVVRIWRKFEIVNSLLGAVQLSTSMSAKQILFNRTMENHLLYRWLFCMLWAEKTCFFLENLVYFQKK